MYYFQKFLCRFKFCRTSLHFSVVTCHAKKGTIHMQNTLAQASLHVCRFSPVFAVSVLHNLPQRNLLTLKRKQNFSRQQSIFSYFQRKYDDISCELLAYHVKCHALLSLKSTKNYMYMYFKMSSDDLRLNKQPEFYFYCIAKHAHLNENQSGIHQPLSCWTCVCPMFTNSVNPDQIWWSHLIRFDTICPSVCNCRNKLYQIIWLD